MKSQTEKQTVVLKCKGNQTIKFGQLVQYNIRNIILEN